MNQYRVLPHVNMETKKKSSSNLRNPSFDMKRSIIISAIPPMMIYDGKRRASLLFIYGKYSGSFLEKLLYSPKPDISMKISTPVVS